MEISTETGKKLCVASVMNSRIDAAAALQFKEAMRQTADNAPPVIILDLRRVEFIDSSGLGALIASFKTIAPQRTLVLAGLTATVKKVFELTRMDSVFNIFPTLENALTEYRD